MEVRFHGRGGQGAVTAAELLVKALSLEGKYGQSQASYGIERRGAPVMAFLRVEDKPITIRSRIRNPQCVVVLDAQLPEIVNVVAGLKEGGIAVLNTIKNPEEVELGVRLSKVGVVDATKISSDIYGRRPIPITNVIMIGALLATTNLVSLSSVIEAIKHRFKGALAESNELAINTAYSSTKVVVYE